MPEFTVCGLQQPLFATLSGEYNAATHASANDLWVFTNPSALKSPLGVSWILAWGV